MEHTLDTSPTQCMRANTAQGSQQYMDQVHKLRDENDRLRNELCAALSSMA
jgi:hypothetical protein